ncbi:ankyrin repeat domain-containing protein [Granulosicoccus antarcticus]|uniref:Uncharacterized protein n=1 Tax=Granulosicoccus antarcticus IMCC3135 TaxID=1192854 RepID=A0A2Z2NUV2_9GAMM|nr:ankyrin repeat domain-containing protein [Granulosicoccus antarcticus]ASJ75109.1 hypothetical protein IMCC3135_25230 [Granulosicoccus antarcticus IMCC3135]
MLQTMRRCIPLIAVLFLALNGVAQAFDKSPTVATRNNTYQLVDAKARQAWMSAIGNDQAARLKSLLELHEPAQLLAITASNGKSALMVAAKLGELPLVISLVDAGARVNDTTQTNGTAFMFAVLGNQKKTAQWLMNRNADIHVIGSNGWNALSIAAAKGYVDLLQWLIVEHADAQLRDVYWFTPLMRAVENNHDEVASVLLELPNTDVNVQDEFGNTSLHHAVSADNAAMVELLLQHGADTNIRNRNGSVAAMLADDKPDMQSLLRKAEHLSGRH